MHVELTLTTKEMASLLKRQPRTIAKRCRAGKFPGAFQDAGDWRITKADFLKTIKPLRRKSGG